ncbi:MAG: hypothetical protein ACOZAA_01090 [Pseudomonadota bacterium]
MLKTAISTIAFLIAASPAFASDFNGAKAVCADAIALEAGRSLNGAKTKLVKARDGATMRITVKVTFEDGAPITGECKVKGGAVQSVTLKS